MALSRKSVGILAGTFGLVAGIIGGSAIMAQAGFRHGGEYGPGMGGHHGMGPGPHMERMFGEMDANGDASITREEFDAFRADRFGQFDADQDGAVTPKEMTTGMRKLRFQALDADGNGQISEAEYMDAQMGGKRGWGGRHFSRMDTDGDGRLSKEEMDAFSNRMFSRMDDNEDGVVQGNEMPFGPKKN
ncbi:hypothetical protein HH303_08405 [Rhodospirillaceae bacterium KN72]|uniref:peptidylprolyl isomerase n=1 Tax=Pacificispira spongiicola TaxID=2729598 RepID=A0A7Y0HFE6_9PROT|nr:EF-hand domain-containing protein [Pacificispira spongiicola]NMM44498.1 hypothetical protein [Pacificispira spongiicola]